MLNGFLSFKAALNSWIDEEATIRTELSDLWHKLDQLKSANQAKIESLELELQENNARLQVFRDDLAVIKSVDLIATINSNIEVLSSKFETLNEELTRISDVDSYAEDIYLSKIKSLSTTLLKINAKTITDNMYKVFIERMQAQSEYYQWPSDAFLPVKNFIEDNARKVTQTSIQDFLDAIQSITTLYSIELYLEENVPALQKKLDLIIASTAEEIEDVIEYIVLVLKQKESVDNIKISVASSRKLIDTMRNKLVKNNSKDLALKMEHLVIRSLEEVANICEIVIDNDLVISSRVESIVATYADDIELLYFHKENSYARQLGLEYHLENEQDPESKIVLGLELKICNREITIRKLFLLVLRTAIEGCITSRDDESHLDDVVQSISRIYFKIMIYRTYTDALKNILSLIQEKNDVADEFNLRFTRSALNLQILKTFLMLATLDWVLCIDTISANADPVDDIIERILDLYEEYEGFHNRNFVYAQQENPNIELDNYLIIEICNVKQFTADEKFADIAELIHECKCLGRNLPGHSLSPSV